MSSHESDPDAVKAFWARYAQAVLNPPVPTNSRSWYPRHAKRFLEADTIRLRERTPEQVEHFFSELCHIEDTEPWQAAQIVHAVEILFREFVIADWVTHFD